MGFGPPIVLGCRLAGGLLLLMVAAPLSAHAEPRAANLIEYSYGGFGSGDDMGSGILSGPMLFPSIVKVFEDGRIVLYHDDRYYAGVLDTRRLERLRRKLAQSGEKRLL